MHNKEGEGRRYVRFKIVQSNTDLSAEEDAHAEELGGLGGDETNRDHGGCEQLRLEIHVSR